MRIDVLFRYRPFHKKFLREEIEKGRIFFCRLDSFNDPYEGRIGTKLEYTRATCLEMLRAWRSLPEGTEEEQKMGDLAFGDRFSHLQRIHQSVLEMKEADLERTADKMAKLASGHVLKNQFMPMLEGMRKQTVVACFSEISNDPVMFAHYADCHRGVCLQYEVTEHVHDLHQVEYCTELPIVTVESLKLGVGTWIQQYALTKAEPWEREKEWRIVYHPAPQIAVQTHGMKIRKVVMGVAISQKACDRIANWCQNSTYGKIELAQARLSESGYEISEEHIDT